MRIKTTREINARTQDGRVLVADEGSVREINDEDAAMVGLAKSLIMSGQAQHYGDVGSVHEELPMIDMADPVDEADAEHYVDEPLDDELDEDGD